MQEGVEAAHLIDGDLLARLLPAAAALAFDRLAALVFGQRIRLQQAQVRVVALGQPATGQTTATGATGRRDVLTEQGLGEAAGQIELADTPLTGDEERVRQLCSSRAQLLPDLVV